MLPSTSLFLLLTAFVVRPFVRAKGSIAGLVGGVNALVGIGACFKKRGGWGLNDAGIGRGVGEFCSRYGVVVVAFGYCLVLGE